MQTLSAAPVGHYKAPHEALLTPEQIWHHASWGIPANEGLRWALKIHTEYGYDVVPLDAEAFSDGCDVDDWQGVLTEVQAEVQAEDAAYMEREQQEIAALDRQYGSAWVVRDLQHLSRVALVGRNKILQLASEPIEYVWADIAVSGTIILISGPPSEGKTTLLFLALAARLHYGEPITLLGRLIHPAPEGKYVILIEGEHSEHSTSRKLVKSFETLGLDSAGLDRVIIVARKAVLLGSPEWQDVVMLVQRGLVSDIAIDTVARVAPADANDERQQVAIFAEVAKAMESAPEGQTQPLTWTVAHNRKNGTDGGLGDVSGSAQRTGQADTVLMVKGEKVGGQTVSSTVTFAKLREDPDDYPRPATFAVERAPDGRWSLRDEAKPVDDRPLEVRILELVTVEPRTKTKLATLLGRSNADVEEAITNLFDARQITTTDIKVNGRSFKAFAPRQSTRRAPDEAPDPDEHPTSTRLH